MSLADLADEWGSTPSLTPTRKTARHSAPLAECSEAMVTPAPPGASWRSARSASSAANSRNVPEGERTAQSCAEACSAANDSHCERSDPVPGGAVWDQPMPISNAVTACGTSTVGPSSPPAATAAPRMRAIALRTSGREKKPLLPDTW